MSKHTDAQRRVLGKGLSALLPQRHSPAQTTPQPMEVEHTSPPSQENSFARTVPIDRIHPNPNQPRQSFDETSLAELAQSIRANGIIQPLTVCETSNGLYTIVAGERRWRAAKLVGLAEVPVFIRAAESDKLLELALIENIQREDLNPMETARAFDQLIDQYRLTHEQIAERTGKDRSTITNSLRLLRLAPEVQEHVANGRIAMGHARALLALEHPASQIALSGQVIEKDLSVRATELLVRQMLASKPADTKAPLNPEKKLDANTKAALDEMAMALGTKVRIIPRTEHSGRIEIEYYSQEDLQRIYEAIVPVSD
jgi:ParB family transcriptional regulator, chromosome partitioning protein